MEFENNHISRAMFEENLFIKSKSGKFTTDISPLLSPNIHWDFDQAYRIVNREIIEKLPGNMWAMPSQNVLVESGS